MIATIGKDCLRSLDQVLKARNEMKAAGVSCLSNSLLTVLHRWRLHPGPVVGDWLKSWDVWQTIQTVRAEIRSDEAVVDFGAYGCEILPALDRLGFTCLEGIDLDHRLGHMPGAGRIKYTTGNFLCSKLTDGSIAAITSISVIEHGFDGQALMREVARVLRLGGIFVASFDYWPTKIDTAGVKLFGLDWRIFSEAEVDDLIRVAAECGLEPLGGGDLTCASPPIHWGGKDYTFGWLALRKVR